MAILFGLLILSIPFIRHRVYELFYHVHFWLAVTYLGLMFWHAGQEGDSWAYLWASLAIWLATIVARTFYYTQPMSLTSSRWFVGSPLILKRYPDNMTRLELLAPIGFHWMPGQHVYLRLPQLNVFDNHPFTIASADIQARTKNSQQSLHLYMRSYAGFTRRLRNHMERTPDTQLEAWLEGPYGGHRQDLTLQYDNLILVAGGGGISAVLPWLEAFVHKVETKQPMQTTSVHLYWSIKHHEAIAWIAEALERLNLTLHQLQVKVTVYVTQDDEQREEKTASESSDDDKIMKEIPDRQRESKPEDLGIEIREGRVNLSRLFNDLPTGSRDIVVGKSSCRCTRFLTDHE